jgi:hypothetical protein
MNLGGSGIASIDVFLNYETLTELDRDCLERRDEFLAEFCMLFKL